MPLLDHFHPPLEQERHWEGLHSAWANAIVMQLNDAVLPLGYVAEPQISLGTQVEVDVAAQEETEAAQGAEQNGGIATALYAPPRPVHTLPIDFSAMDIFEIRVQREEGGLKLVAAIELASPGSKDRPENRRAFGRKCAAYLQEGIGLIIVDVVTDRLANLHAELVQELAGDVEFDLSDPDTLYAVAYQARLRRKKSRLAIWPKRLAVGRVLPTLPLWLSDVLAVPVDFERSYRAACKALRIKFPASE